MCAESCKSLLGFFVWGVSQGDRFSNSSLSMADRGARYKVYEPIDDKNLLTPCCGADTPTCTFSASVANDQALSVARAELAVEQCASPFRYYIDHGTSLAQFGSTWKSLAQGSAWPSVASTSKRLKTKVRGERETFFLTPSRCRRNHSRSLPLPLWWSYDVAVLTRARSS